MSDTPTRLKPYPSSLLPSRGQDDRPSREEPWEISIFGDLTDKQSELMERLLSVPRDLWVTKADGQGSRLNEVFGEEGPQALVDAVAAAGAVEHVWRVVDDMPLGEVVATFAKKIRQLSVYVATNGSGDAEDNGAAAFAFPSAAELTTPPAQDAPDAPDEGEGDLLDWFLATGAHRVNYTWRSATA